MLAELGLFCLILAACFAGSLAVFVPIAFYRGEPSILSLAPRLINLMAFFCVSAFILLALLFVQDDFSVLYVANNSSISLPWWYKWCALWGGHEGSMLLWVTLLSIWGVLVSLFSKDLEGDTRALVLAIIGMVATGFFLFIILTSNPFLRLFDGQPKNGLDLNPLLQDVGFIFHPPVLYTGYVGFAIAFAVAIASLIKGEFDPKWARWTRLWTLAAWSALTLGITLGSWWAYRELGWGGWWFWDPVENASLMPWLVGTALLHSLIVSEKRQTFNAWTILLSISAFILSLIGTFLVRSGVLTSVHAFAVSPERGLFMLLFLAVTVSASLMLYALRAQKIINRSHFSMLSREAMLLTNNVFLTVMMATVLLGTLYPLVIDALNLGKISVGPPYFNSLMAPMMLPLLLLMGIAPQCYWKHMPVDLLIARFKQVAGLCSLLTVFLYLTVLREVSVIAFLGMSLSLWMILATLISFFSKVFLSKRLRPSKQLAMVIAHLGVGIAVLGISVSTSFGVDKFVRMGEGDSLIIAKQRLVFEKELKLEGPNYHGAEVLMRLEDGKSHSYLRPQKRIYNVSKMVMTDSDINYNLFRDVYVALGEPLDNGDWSVRVYYKPLVRWIWLGGLLVFLGGLIAAFLLLKERLLASFAWRSQKNQVEVML